MRVIGIEPDRLIEVADGSQEIATAVGSDSALPVEIGIVGGGAGSLLATGDDGGVAAVCRGCVGVRLARAVRGLRNAMLVAGFDSVRRDGCPQQLRACLHQLGACGLDRLSRLMHISFDRIRCRRRDGRRSILVPMSRGGDGRALLALFGRRDGGRCTLILADRHDGGRRYGRKQRISADQRTGDGHRRSGAHPLEPNLLTLELRPQLVTLEPQLKLLTL